MIVNWVGGAFIVLVFFTLLKMLRVITVSREVISLSSSVMNTMNDKQMSDLEKEKAMQTFSIRLFRHFLVILLGSAVAIGLPVLILWGLQWMGWVSLDAIIETTLTWEFIVASCLMGVVLWVFTREKNAG